MPPGLPALLEIQGLGPKKVKRLFDELGVDSVETLEAACKENRIAGLEGFGEKSQSKILEAIAFKRQFASRHRLIDALIQADPILEFLRGHPHVVRCSTAGSLRRWKEVIGDIDERPVLGALEQYSRDGVDGRQFPLLPPLIVVAATDVAAACLL